MASLALDLFCWKATKSRSLISDFCFQVLGWLTVLSEHLLLSIQGCPNIYAYNHNSFHRFHLLLYVTEIVKQFQTMRSGRFESNFLTLQGKPNTQAWGTTSPTWLFPLSFQSVDQGHPPRLQSPTTLHPHVALILDKGPEESGSQVHSLVQSGT